MQEGILTLLVSIRLRFESGFEAAFLLRCDISNDVFLNQW